MKKLAVVTGGGSGIGKALTMELASQGINVVIIGRDEKKLQATQKEYPQLIKIIKADIAIDKERKQVAETLMAEDHIDFLVHNAGVETPVTAFANIALKDWQYSFAVNTEAPVFLTQYLLKKLKKDSRILMISSGLAHRPLTGLLTYCTTKAALYMTYQGLNAELNSQGIYVGSVTPGVIETDMQTRLREDGAKELPGLAFFKDLKEKGELRDPQVVAKEIIKILLTTNNHQFSKQEWNL